MFSFENNQNLEKSNFLFGIEVFFLFPFIPIQLKYFLSRFFFSYLEYHILLDNFGKRYRLLYPTILFYMGCNYKKSLGFSFLAVIYIHK